MGLATSVGPGTGIGLTAQCIPGAGTGKSRPRTSRSQMRTLAMPKRRASQPHVDAQGCTGGSRLLVRPPIGPAKGIP